MAVDARLKRVLSDGVTQVDWQLNDAGGVDTLPTDPVKDAGVRAQLDITLSALRDAITKTGATTKTLADVVAALAANLNVNVVTMPAVNVGLTDTQLRASAPSVKDDYQTGETLTDQTGAGAALTFTFSAAVQLVVIEAKGANQTARADAFGGTPTASQGVVCDDAVPTYIPVNVTIVKVFAPAGMVVSVYGLRRT